jgi:hypothetical protein
MSYKITVQLSDKKLAAIWILFAHSEEEFMGSENYRLLMATSVSVPNLIPWWSASIASVGHVSY